MQMVNTEWARLRPIPGVLKAVTLVLDHPGSTLSELASHHAGGLDQCPGLASRMELLPALQKAELRGALAYGPRRDCRVGRCFTRTWLPGDPMAMPLQPAPGLRGLHLRAMRLIAELAAEEALA